MPAPRGFGWWIAFERTISPGPKSEDLRVAIEQCLATGARWVALRAGAGGNDDADLTEESIRAFDAAGIDVYLWIFPYPNTSTAELADWKRWRSVLRQGEGSSIRADAPVGTPIVQGAIINAEYEYQPASAAQARTLVQAIRSIGYDFVAHAPPDYLGAGVNQPLSDELVALDDVCDMIMPQIYSLEHSDEGSAHHVEQVMKGYAKRGLGPDIVCPIGSCYRPKVRGFETMRDADGKPILDEKGKPKTKPRRTPSMPNEAQFVADDTIAFLDHPLVADCPAISLYTLDATHWINGDGDLVVPAIAARAARLLERRRTDPAPMEPGLQIGDGGPPHQPYIVDRLEAAEEEKSK